jgi:putative transcriptional regulator
VKLDSLPTRGCLLISSPTLQDSNFSRTVILLCAHDTQGSMGLVLNRPTSFSLSEALMGVPRTATEKLFWGGPVQEDQVTILQRTVPDTASKQPISEGIEFGDEQDFLREVGDEGDENDPNSKRFRMFAGYSGWGEGQLQQELDQCGWLIAPAAPSLVFETAPEAIWSAAIHSLGPEFAHLASMPRDPRVN